MVDSKENYKFVLGVEGLISSVNYTLSHKNKINLIVWVRVVLRRAVVSGLCLVYPQP